MEEDHSTPSSHTLLHMAAEPFSLLLVTSLSHTLCTLSLTNCALNKYAFFIGKYGQSWKRHSNHNTWHELCRNSCSHLLGGGVLPQMAIS